MSIEKVVPYPGVDEADAVDVETDKLQEKKNRLWAKREDKRDREEERSVDKELKQLDYEEKHPKRVRIKKRLRSGEKGVRKQVGRAWKHTEGVAKDVLMYRKANPPRVIPRPRGMRMAPGPSQRSSNMNQGEAVSSSTERDFFGSQQQPGQQKDFFGPPKLLDLIGGSNAPKKEVDYIGNKKKKETRYY